MREILYDVIAKGKDFDEQMQIADERMYDMKVALKKKFGEPMR